MLRGDRQEHDVTDVCSGTMVWCSVNGRFTRFGRFQGRRLHILARIGSAERRLVRSRVTGRQGHVGDEGVRDYVRSCHLQELGTQWFFTMLVDSKGRD